MRTVDKVLVGACLAPRPVRAGVAHVVVLLPLLAAVDRIAGVALWSSEAEGSALTTTVRRSGQAAPAVAS